jgi:hypothetical protein
MVLLLEQVPDGSWGTTFDNEGPNALSADGFYLMRDSMTTSPLVVSAEEFPVNPFPLAIHLFRCCTQPMQDRCGQGERNLPLT